MKTRGIWFAVSLIVIAGLVIGSSGCAQPAPTSSPTSSPSQKPATTAAPAPAPAKAIVLKAGGFGAPDYSLTILMEEAHKTIEQRSNGQVTFKWYPNESLVKSVEVYNAIPAGILDIGITSSGQKEALGLPAFIKNLPFVWDIELFHAHYRDPGSWFDFQQQYWEKLGLHVLSEGFTGYTQLAMRNTPVRKLADFKGKLIRVPAGLTQAMKLFGAEATFINPSESYEAMQRGSVDGFVGSFDQMKTSSIPEVAKYFTKWDIGLAGLQMIMGTKIRAELPADIVKLIDQAYLEAERNQQKRLIGELNQLEEYIRKYPGVVEMYILPSEERAIWGNALQPMWDAAKAKVSAADWKGFLEVRKALSK